MSVNDDRVPLPDQVTKAKGESKHQPALDGVRGLAILLVLSVHLLGANTEGHGTGLHILGEVLASGYVGVYLFFALSGYLITGILMDTIHAPTYYKTFYARRSLRIFPLYYGVLILLLLLSRHFHFDWGGWALQLSPTRGTWHSGEPINSYRSAHSISITSGLFR